MELTFNNKKVNLNSNDADTFDYVGMAMSLDDFPQDEIALSQSYKEFASSFQGLSEAINKGDEKVAQEKIEKIAGFDSFLGRKLGNGKTVYQYFYENTSFEAAKLDKFFGIFKTVLGLSIDPEKLGVKEPEKKAAQEPEQLLQPKTNGQKKLMRGRLHMEDHFFDLNSPEKKAHFIALGAAEKNIFKNDGVFSGTEQNTFKDIFKYHFNPARMEKGKAAPNYEAFNERIEALAAEVKELNRQHGEFIKNNDFSEFLGKEASKRDKLYVSGLVCPAAIRSKAVSDYIGTAIDNKTISPDYMRKYLEVHYERDDLDLEGDDLVKDFKAVISRKMLPETGLDVEGGNEYHSYYYEVGKYRDSGKNVNFTDEQKEKIAEASKKAREDISKTLKGEKAWRRTKDSITWDSLERLNNIYVQFNKEGNIMGGSKEYKDLLKTLKAAHNAYKNNKDTYKFKGAEVELDANLKKDLRGIYDDVADKAMVYLKGKRSKRSSEERYEIAFSALALTAHGQAARLAEEHNYLSDGQKVKKVALNDLIQRSEYNNVTAYKRVKKNQEKLKLAGKMINGM